MMALEDLTTEHEYTIRVTLAESAKLAVKQLRDLDKVHADDSTKVWYLNHLSDIHDAYRVLTGQNMQDVHREGTTYDAR